MLFYESSKCFHGRPHTFRGSWYSSVFVHYHPKYGWAENIEVLQDEKQWAIPPHWIEPPTTHFEIPLQMIGTGMIEPTCPNNWCQSQYSIKWSGPGVEGYWIAPTGDRFPFTPSTDKIYCNNLDEECPEWATWHDNSECDRNPSYMLGHCRKSCGMCGVPEGKEMLMQDLRMK